MTYSHEVACDLRNAGWHTTDPRKRNGLAVIEFYRGDKRKWILVDTATDVVVGGSY
jgi:hypothetical protein